MRRVLQPRSNSLPHVTVRYTTSLRETRIIERLYAEYNVADLALLEPATFDTYGSTSEVLQSLVLRCASESIEFVTYRPVFYDSFLHLTLYHGPPSRLAARALERLGDFSWNVRLLKSGHVTRHHPGSRDRGEKREKGITLSAAAAQLLERLSGTGYTSPSAMDDDHKLELIAKLAEVVHESREVAPLRGVASNAREIHSSGNAVAIQHTLWPDNELPGMHRSNEAGMHDRRVTGTILTPPELALDVVGAALGEMSNGTPIEFGDPAIGTGIFFASLVSLAPADRIRSAYGFETDRRRGLETARRWGRIPLRVIIGDFLVARDEAPRRNLVIANPPYLRYERQNRAEMRAAEQTIAAETNLAFLPRSNLYVHFLLAAHRWMAPGAVAAWVIPSEFLSSRYGATVRRYLTHKVQLVRLHTYEADEQVFDNARVSPSVVVFKNSPPIGSMEARISAGGTMGVPVHSAKVPVGSLDPQTSWAPRALFLPRRSGSTRSTQLGEFFRIRRGIATGGNGFFVLSDALSNELRVPRRWKRAVLPKARYLNESVVYGDADGTPQLERRLWLIDSDEAIVDVEAEAPEFARYLRGMPPKVASGVLVQRRSHPFKQETVKTPLFVFVSMARSHTEVQKGRFILNLSDAVALNNYHLLYPRAHVERWLDEGVTTPMELLEKLQSIPESELLAVGRRHAANLVKLEPADLRMVRLDLSAIGAKGES